MKDMHLTVGEDLLERLDCVSRRVARSRAVLVREAVTEYLAREERRILAQDMARYATEMAPYSGEFVTETDLEVERQLSESTQW